MPDLIAQGTRPQDCWRRVVPTSGDAVVLGRTAEPWSVPWDDRISRQHATLNWSNNKLQVNKLPQARNEIFFRGKRCDQFSAAVGEHFVIGQTTFTVDDQQISALDVTPPVFAEQTFSSHLLRQNQYKDGGQRIEALGKIPEIIAGAIDDEELYPRIVNLLLQGIPHASFVAILQYVEQSPDAGDEPASDDELNILHWDCRDFVSHQFTPSRQLVKSASETKQSVLHVWNRALVANNSYTHSENIDWAFCTPVESEACPGWSIYVAGNFAGRLRPSNTVDNSQMETLQDDLKFTELTATTLGALRQVRALQRRQDSLRNFFAPVVLEALSKRDANEVLAPRETNVSILFCDLRGFSQHSEESADRLLELLQRVSDALGVMTHHIFSNDGVVGDFHGDAAMGFWGWPFDNGQSILGACRAALAIRQEFQISAAQPGHPLANFRAGLGIASGPAVAGSIGTKDQVKVTVFGPVVNLASRLEAMTKQLQASILLDEPTAEWVRAHVPGDILRVRRVAKVIPYGMLTPLVVSELLPPAGKNGVLTDEQLAAYEAALDHFIQGDWHSAFRLLHEVPAEDQVKDFLTVTIAGHRRQAPADWQGVIKLPAK
ncbi:MAG: adenylate/guanylate cyclase domain-containing protein [Pirellulaceae bacterium]|jgi:adenylate cyclase|nr:adenylate/guanylate cyclase domain-containing protein [Pirellulaceae bacterium]